MVMKRFIAVFISVFGFYISLFSQTSTEHFVFEDNGKDLMRMLPKGVENTLLAKGTGKVDLDYSKINWLQEIEVSVFQSLIDRGVFTAERMRELCNANERIFIWPYIDETGVVGYVRFTYRKEKGTLLTDEELYAIYQALMGKKYDMSGVTVWEWDEVMGVRTKQLSSFYISPSFFIPFRWLKF